MNSMPSVSSAVGDLSPRFTGELVQPRDTAYDDVRKVHNGLVDKRPALIARCRGDADIVDAVELAKRLNLEVAVRGGGHNVGGRATTEGGVMIDLAPMKSIHVDAIGHTARAQGGVTWGEFNRETQLHGLATTGGVVSTTGIAGLTLGGGIGWLMGKHGLALDNLLSVDLIMADGRTLRASEDENPDLFWAVRGGGGNFGIASSFEYRVHPVGPMITGGLVAHSLGIGVDVLKQFRDVASSAPDDMMIVAALLSAPDPSAGKLAAIGIGHCGSLDDAEVAVRPVKSFGTPVMNMISSMPYCELNSMLDASYPRGARNYWKSHFLKELSDNAISTLVACFEGCPSSMGQIVLERFHGAATRIPVDKTAFALRSSGFNLLVLSQWTDPSADDRCVAWARNTYAAMQPFVSSERYLNYLDHDEAGDPAAAAYGPNYARLRELKAKYDSENFFHVNLNIQPVK
jgi:hypothetical protein